MLKPIPLHTCGEIQTGALMINGLWTDRPAERARSTFSPAAYPLHLRLRQTRDPRSWNVLPNKQKPSWGMSPASARLQERSGWRWARLCARGEGRWGKAISPRKGRKASPRATGLKCCFPYLEQGLEKISADKNV